MYISNYYYYNCIYSFLISYNFDIFENYASKQWAYERYVVLQLVSLPRACKYEPGLALSRLNEISLVHKTMVKKPFGSPVHGQNCVEPSQKRTDRKRFAIVLLLRLDRASIRRFAKFS